MSDLHEKFLWAESHPEEAFKISKQATQFVKDFITPDGLKSTLQTFCSGNEGLHRGVHGRQGGLQLNHRGYGE